MTGAPNRGLKKRGFKVLAKNPARAAILVEGGFISNAAERRRCQDSRYQFAVAQAVVMGMMDTFGRPRKAVVRQPQWAQQAPTMRPSPRSWGRQKVVVATFSGMSLRWRR